MTVAVLTGAGGYIGNAHREPLPACKHESRPAHDCLTTCMQVQALVPTLVRSILMRIMSMPYFSCIQAKALLESRLHGETCIQACVMTCQAVASAPSHFRRS